MDRKIIYPGQIPMVEDQLQAARFTQIGVGRLAGALYDESGTGASGFACTPGSGLSVTISPGQIIQPGMVDASAFGVLPASASALPRQYVLTDPVNIVIPGTGATYIVYGTASTSDTANTVLPYYNSANPSQTFAGAGNNGQNQPTVRADSVTIGVAASVPSGSIPLWSIVIPGGATAITTAMISVASGAPLYPSLRSLAMRSVAPFNANLAAAFKGYPSKAIVADPTTTGLFWVSTADNNLTTPGAQGASWVNLFAGLISEKEAEATYFPLTGGNILGQAFVTASFSQGDETTTQPIGAALGGLQFYLQLTNDGAANTTYGRLVLRDGAGNYHIGIQIDNVGNVTDSQGRPFLSKPEAADTYVGQGGGNSDFSVQTAGVTKKTSIPWVSYVDGDGNTQYLFMQPAGNYQPAGDYVANAGGTNGGIKAAAIDGTTGAPSFQDGNGNWHVVQPYGYGQKNTGQNGYFVHPSGIIEQWGYYTTGSDGTVVVYFPMTFPNACLNVVVSEGRAGGSWFSNQPTWHGVYASPSTGNFEAVTRGFNNGSINAVQASGYFRAIGY